jgi:hypothetical protein
MSVQETKHQISKHYELNGVFLEKENLEIEVQKSTVIRNTKLSLILQIRRLSILDLRIPRLSKIDVIAVVPHGSNGCSSKRLQGGKGVL